MSKLNKTTNTWENIGHFPQDEDLALHFTVFAVPAVTSVRVKEMIASESCRVFPNPAGNIATVEYGCSYPTTVKFAIVDMLGRIIQDFPPESVEPGVYQSRLDIAQLPAGSYLCRIMIGDTVLTRALIIAK